VAEQQGFLAKLTGALSEAGADIVTLGTFWGDDIANREIAFKVQGIACDRVEQILTGLGADVVDLRTC